MAIKTILVCLTTEEQAEALMRSAVLLARSHDAHLIGLHTLEALVVYPGIAVHVADPFYGAFNSAQEEETAAIEATFRAAVEQETFSREWRLVKAGSTTAGDRMLEYARAADLVIMARPDPETDRPDQAHVQARLIRDSGRPVLIVPPDYEAPSIGKRALIGWSATREATRAAFDVLDLMPEEAEAIILRVGDATPDDEAEFASEQLAATLARHGVETKILHRERDGKETSAVLLDEAEAEEADLIVTGAFGHSRVYDFVVGAATRDLLLAANLPVLFSK